MAQKSMKAPHRVVERNILLTGMVMDYLIRHADLLDVLPQDFELVILPEDDPELRLYNLELLDKLGSQSKPIVFARLPAKQTSALETIHPNLYVPIAG